MPNYRRSRALIAALVMGVVSLIAAGERIDRASAVQDRTREALTPIQVKIEKQRQRLSSPEIEDRRDALMQLRALQRPEASRAALSALNDPAPIVRATAAASVLWLSGDESAASLIPLLSDKEEFVRQQTAYALGQTRSRSAVAALIERLADKKISVRGAAAVALGQIADATAVTSLAAVLNPQAGLTQSKKSQKSKTEKNLFVLRAAARSLGQIGNRAGLPALIIVLQDEKAADDLRREAAIALGAIGDAAAIPALREAVTARDPYLGEAAHEAIRKISRSQTTGGI
ncbi:MAG: HEAT repeat domain-containing protein [Pyrinomonadaceae bacterium]